VRVEAQDSRSVRFSHFHSGSSAAHAEAVALDGHRRDEAGGLEELRLGTSWSTRR